MHLGSCNSTLRNTFRKWGKVRSSPPKAAKYLPNTEKLGRDGYTFV
jgi:hypothetical protein